VSGKYWNATDTDGDCSRCGIAWTEEEKAGDERHECPPGFWKPLRGGTMTKITAKGIQASLRGVCEYNRCEFFRNIDQAQAFQAGIEFVNDSAITVTGIIPSSKDKSEMGYAVLILDEDYQGKPQKATAIRARKLGD
jgi:hypothetical protein